MMPRRTWAVYRWDRAIQIVRERDQAYWHLQWRWPFLRFYASHHTVGSYRGDAA